MSSVWGTCRGSRIILVAVEAGLLLFPEHIWACPAIIGKCLNRSTAVIWCHRMNLGQKCQPRVLLKSQFGDSSSDTSEKCWGKLNRFDTSSGIFLGLGESHIPSLKDNQSHSSLEAKTLSFPITGCNTTYDPIYVTLSSMLINKMNLHALPPTHQVL